MNALEQEYELVARRLDGEDVQLTPAQQALADEIAADQARVGPLLAPPLPAGLLHRVHARLTARPARLAPRVAWARWGVVAAAAVILLAVAFLSRGPARSNSPMSAADYISAFLHTPGSELEMQAEMLSNEMDNYQVELALGDTGPVDQAVRAMDDAMTDAIADVPDVTGGGKSTMDD
jgi:hypothetical protein